jgi:hypothetical protein
LLTAFHFAHIPQVKTSKVRGFMASAPVELRLVGMPLM